MSIHLNMEEIEKGCFNCKFRNVVPDTKCKECIKIGNYAWEWDGVHKKFVSGGNYYE